MSADGTWNMTMNTPMGAQSGTLELKTEGGSLSGALKSPQGEMEFADGTVDGNALSWTVQMTAPMPMKLEFNATVEGDALSGQVKLGSFGNATLEGTRA